MTATAEKKTAAKRPAKTLSPEQQEIFDRRGQWYKDRLVEITRDQLAEVSNPVVFLSGGVESSTILWSIIENGVKPGVITYKVPGVPLSKDGHKAQHMAEFYGLDFHICELPSDPEELAMGIVEIGTKYEGLSSRPEYECVFIYSQMIRFAAKLGFDSVFCGLGDIDNMYFNGRANEIMHKAGTLSQRYMDTEALKFLTNLKFQALEFITEAKDVGVTGYLPMMNMSVMLPYIGVPKEVMNFGGKKNISVVPYQNYVDESTGSVIVGSMQLGDTGARQYFDGSIAASKKVDNFFNKSITSGTQLVNALNIHKTGELSRSFYTRVWSTLRQNLHGVDNHPHNAKERFYAVDKDGLAVIPPEWEEGSEGADLFDTSYSEIVEVFNEDGTPDRRLDCWGNAFFEGPEVAQTGCARAQAGLCGRFLKEDPTTDHPIVECEYYDKATRMALEGYDLLTEAYTDGGQNFMKKWRPITESRYQELRDQL